MTLSVYSWEHRLLAWAKEAFQQSDQTTQPASTQYTLLLNAYDNCKAITKHHSKTFYMASSLLSRDKRNAIHALYAFCRLTDDIVDRESANMDKDEALILWQEQIANGKTLINHPVLIAWHDTQSHFHIPAQYAEQLIRGVRQDLEKNRYKDFAEVAEYAYGVASTVGLMVMHIIGYSHPDAIHYALRLGVALQITNILRDIGEDWQNGRIYLPQDELAEFGLTEMDIANGIVDDRWREFMRFQIQRNRRLYTESLPGVRFLHPDGRFAIMAAAELYQAILDQIEANDYDVFRNRANLSKLKKISKLPNIWWRSRA